MSAYVMNDQDFQLIGMFAEQYMGANAATVADLLKRENVRSVNCRYPSHKERYAKVKFDNSTASYCMTVSGYTLATLVIDRIECLFYQSCEPADYLSTPARTMGQMIKLHAERVIDKNGK